MNSESENPRSESSDTPPLKTHNHASDVTAACESKEKTSSAFFKYGIKL
jgi:hypothetical protein